MRRLNRRIGERVEWTRVTVCRHVMTIVLLYFCFYRHVMTIEGQIIEREGPSLGDTDGSYKCNQSTRN